MPEVKNSATLTWAAVSDELRAEVVTGQPDGVASLNSSGDVVERLAYEGAADGVATLDANSRVAQSVKLMNTGTAAAPGLAFEGDTDTGVYRVGANEFGVATGGSNRVTVSSAGLNASNLLRAGSQVFSRDNVVGTVTQSGGVPTGAIVERDDNANGEYVRFADGTQIAWRTVVGTTTISTSYFGGFRSSLFDRNWAAEFVDDEYVAVGIPAEFAFGLTEVTEGTPGRTSARSRWIFTAVTSQSSFARTGYVMAVGRWY